MVRREEKTVTDELFDLTLRAEQHEVPAIVRLRALLKRAAASTPQRGEETMINRKLIKTIDQIAGLIEQHPATAVEQFRAVMRGIDDLIKDADEDAHAVLTVLWNLVNALKDEAQTEAVFAEEFPNLREA
jgi:hypothetical protein